jgi:hypothetical protein
LCLAVLLASPFEAGRAAGAGDAAADEKAVVGRWDLVRAGKEKATEATAYMRFYKDGTFTSTVLFLTTTDGKYTFLSDKVIELDFPGVFYGRNKVEFKYKLSGDVLTLEEPARSIDLEFKRLDSGK